ncbi:MAG TPA: molybdate ABC transporter permease subunit [Gammaproteobacteria bacterium]|jgi:molybdate transport system permease protein|nr:molybdate ABC transporter permease subunit [Gammaproteobacteria bacterium]
MLTPDDIQALLLTLKLAAVSTVILLLLGTPLAWWLAHTRWRAKFLIESVIALPLVLPPTVLGFYLLLALGPNGIAGGSTLAFTFYGLVIGSVIYSLPFVVQPLQDAFISVGRRPLEVAATLRTSPLMAFFKVAMPLARPGFITAAILGFAHTLGEFGVVLMIGGNIPGETRVASIAIYDHVESLEYAQAHILAAVLLIVSFVMLVAVFILNRRFRTVRL